MNRLSVIIPETTSPYRTNTKFNYGALQETGADVAHAPSNAAIQLR